MRVLVADDDPVYRHLLVAMLADWGYAVTAVADGAAAWAALDRDGAPELAILDSSMPGLPGEEVCRRLRARPSERYTFVVLLSANGGKADRLAALEAGADEHLAKPFDAAELKARLAGARRILQVQQQLITAREAMRRQATRDSLTGAWNHAAILEVFERELGRARREGRPLGVVLADLDHFKGVNDTHGHLAGDAALREVTARILSAMRPYDLVGRYGGEEFLVLLPGCDEDSTLKVCERVRQRIADGQVSHNAQPFVVTVSLGATVFQPTSADTTQTLLAQADRALYAAKAAGRNRVELLGC